MLEAFCVREVLGAAHGSHQAAELKALVLISGDFCV